MDETEIVIETKDKNGDITSVIYSLKYLHILGNLSRDIIKYIASYVNDFDSILSLRSVNKTWRRCTLERIQILAKSNENNKLNQMWNNISSNPSIDLETLLNPDNIFFENVKWLVRLGTVSMNTTQLRRIFNGMLCLENPITADKIDESTWLWISSNCYLTREFIYEYDERLSILSCLKPLINKGKPTFNVTLEFLNKYHHILISRANCIADSLSVGEIFYHLATHNTKVFKEYLNLYEKCYIRTIFILMNTHRAFNIDCDFLDRHFAVWTTKDWERIKQFHSRLTPAFKERAQKLGKINPYDYATNTGLPSKMQYN